MSVSYPAVNSYVFLRHYMVGTDGTTQVAWVFVVAYLPVALQQNEVIPSFFRDELRMAFADLLSLGRLPFSEYPYSRNVIYRIYFVSNIAGSSYLDASNGAEVPAYEAANRILKEFGIPYTGVGRFEGVDTGQPESFARGDSRAVQREVVMLLNTPSEYSIGSRPR